MTLPHPPHPPYLPHLFILSLFILGLLFRLSHLDQKIFWVDEVATVVRAVGYTKAEIVTQLANGQTHTAPDLLAYQQLTPSRSLTDSLTALSRSPEHAPLYFLLTRFWMAAFGSSIGAIRSLSVLCSLLAIPAAGWLCRELSDRETRGDARVGLVAMALLAVSPYFVAYAQEARPYSLWLLTILLCWAALLRAIRLNSLASWAIYSGSLALSLYTSLLSGLLLLGQVFYLGLLPSCRDGSKAYAQLLTRFGLALGAATILFSPWIWVLLQQQQALAANTTWMRTAISPLTTLAIWLYSLAILWFDVPVVPTGWMALVQATIAALVLAVVGYAGYRCGQSWLARTLVALGLPIPLLLLLFDLLFKGQASATSRYLIPTQLAALLAVAFLCHPALPIGTRQVGLRQIGPKRVGSKQVGPRQVVTAKLAGVKPIQSRPAQVMLSGLLALSLVSNGVNLNRSPDYQKARNQANSALAALINQSRPHSAQAPAVPLLAEPAQTMDLLSLSHQLNPTVLIRIAPAQQLLDGLLQDSSSQFRSTPSPCSAALLFNPSSVLLAEATQQGLEPRQIYQPTLLTAADIHLTLWQLPCPASLPQPTAPSGNGEN